MKLSEALEKEPDRTLERAAELQKIISERLENRMKQIESGRSTTPDVKMMAGWRQREFEHAGKPLILLGIGEEMLEGDMYRFEGFEQLSELASRIRISKDVRKKFRRAGANYGNGTVQMKKMKDEDVEDLRSEFPRFEPVFRHLEGEQIPSTVSHELTHAYIDLNTPERRGEKQRIIDEAAAQRTGTLMNGSASPPHGYEWVSRSELHTAEQLLDGRINDIDGIDSKIDVLRKTAVESIRRTHRHPSFDLIQAIDADALNTAKNFRTAVLFMKRAERETGDALNVLGLLEEDVPGELERLENRLETEYMHSIDSVFPETLPADTLSEEELEGELEGIGELSTPEDVGLDEDFLEDDLEDLEGGFDFNETLETIEGAIGELEQIISRDSLNEQEKEVLQDTIEKLENLIDVFRNRRDQVRDQLESGRLKFRISQLTSQEHVDSSKAMKQMDTILSDYETLATQGIKLCKVGIKGLEKVHDSEKRSAQLMKEYSEKEEYREIEKMMKYTEDSYTVLKECKEVLTDSGKNLKMARKRVERVTG